MKLRLNRRSSAAETLACELRDTRFPAPAKISADYRTDAILHSTSPVLPAAEADPAASEVGRWRSWWGGGWRRWVQVVVEVAAAN